MNATTALATLLALALAAPLAAGADDDPLAAALRRVVDDAVAAYDREDAEGFLRHVHTKSAEYPRTRDALPAQFRALDVTTEVVAFRVIGHDDEFAVGRTKLKTTSTAPGCRGNVVDQITLFHQENGVWKYWADYELGVELLP